MKETEMQQLIVDAVNDDGGKAYKMSNRFMIGVSDLIIKMPGYQAGFMEIKRNDVAASTLKRGISVKLDLSALQIRFLEDFQKAGMPAGVGAFLQISGEGLRTLRFATMTFDQAKKQNFMMDSENYHSLGKSDERPQIIRQRIHTWLGDWHREHKND